MGPDTEPVEIIHYINRAYALFLEKVSDIEYRVWRKPRDYEMAFTLRYGKKEGSWRIYDHCEWFIPETIELLNSIITIVVNEMV
ncbi:MAG: hypothetical protein P1Q69_03700 [Candidatus Thorarchaeota archaeon]|nr:hypothetical protein [Candidatus Thorarchaeota archaeon]